jgi:hypothetical protein
VSANPGPLERRYAEALLAPDPPPCRTGDPFPRKPWEPIQPGWQVAELADSRVQELHTRGGLKATNVACFVHVPSVQHYYF